MVGRPTEDSQQSVSTSPSSVQPQSEQTFKLESKRSISVAIRFGDGAEVSRKGLDYVGFVFSDRKAGGSILSITSNMILAEISYKESVRPDVSTQLLFCSYKN